LATSDPDKWDRRSNSRAVLSNFRWVWTHIWKGARIQALALILVELMLGIQPALLIHVVRNLIDVVVEKAGAGIEGFAAILPWLVAYGGTLLLTNKVLWNVRDALQLRLEQNLSGALGRRFLDKSCRLPLVFFENTASYDRLERAGNPGRLAGRLFSSVMHGFESAVKVITVAAIFAPVSPWISLILLAVIVPQIRMEIEQSRMFMSFTYGEVEEQRRARYVDRLLTGRAEQKEMRIFALQETLTDRWNDIRKALRSKLFEQRNREMCGALPAVGIRIVVSVGVAIFLAYFLSARLLTPGGFVALFQGVRDMLGAGGGLGHSSRSIQERSINVEYIREFLDLPEEEGGGFVPGGESIEPQRKSRFPRPLRRGFAVEDLWFAYPPSGSSELRHEREESVLRGVSFEIVPGECVALVGENGSGKSTLAKILLGLYTPASGRVLADGIDFSRIERQSLSSAVSAAFQDYFNFELTLAQSIGLGIRGEAGGNRESELWPHWIHPDPASLLDAAQKSGANEIADKLPEGFDTPVGHVLDGGQGLSGGEWQRIAVARAFTRNPELLILDEPAASLDPMAEAGLYRQITGLLENRTALLISHRLGSARMADRILVLEDGQIVENGHHDDLVPAGGLYAAMWKEQSSWYQ